MKAYNRRKHPAEKGNSTQSYGVVKDWSLSENNLLSLMHLLSMHLLFIHNAALVISLASEEL